MVKRATKPLPAGPNWTFGDIETYMNVINEIATEEYGLDVYPNQIEIVSSEQMLDAYTFTGLPVCYHHWRYGKYFESWYSGYTRGEQNLAYELVINSNPCISYFMEENNLVTQALVAAHACFGHNAFFKNNYLFKEWTHADAIVDYALFARDYIKKCEQSYGVDAVESILDAAHALERHGVDKYKRPGNLSAAAEKALQQKRMEERHQEIWEFWNTLPEKGKKDEKVEDKKFPAQPEENLLYFMEKYSPILEEWQREIVRIVRKFAQYFYPQAQTKLMNEGYATFWHYTLMYRMWELGYLTDGFMQSFIDLHTRVVSQPDYDKGGIQMGGLNPYYIGFHSFCEIRRICENPTGEDRKWFPQLIGQNWVEQVRYAAYNFKDESFVSQYLSPALMRKMKLFCLLDDSGQDHFEVVSIADDDGYKETRKILSRIYNRAYQIPDVQVTEAKIKGDRRLTLQHYAVDDVPLEEKDKLEVMKQIKVLWGFDVQVFSDSKPKRPFSEDDYYVWI